MRGREKWNGLQGLGLRIWGLGFRGIWPWVRYNKIPIYPIFYLLKGDYKAEGLGVKGLGFKDTRDDVCIYIYR